VNSDQDSSAPPFFSVITPSFNQGQFIEQTIRSVLAQDYPYFEHLVFDGKSSDNTIEILQRFHHLRWTSEKDAGQSAALNKGFQLAKGEIIAWINSDDWYEPGAFASIGKFFSENPDKNVVMGNCNCIGANGEKLCVVVNKERGMEQLRRYWKAKSIPTQPAVFFRRKLLEEVGLLDENLHYGMDYDLWLRLARRHRFFHIDQVVANYRFHKNSKGGDGDWKKFMPEWRVVYARHCQGFSANYFLARLRKLA
jgi:glycosyltransferase involved in cell wall biosynthesis